MIDPITRLRCTLGHWKIVIEALDEIDRMRTAAQLVLGRAESVITTDAAGNRFRKVFAQDLDTLKSAVEQKADAK